MHSDVPPVGKINSSNPLINDLGQLLITPIYQIFLVIQPIVHREKNIWLDW